MVFALSLEETSLVGGVSGRVPALYRTGTIKRKHDTNNDILHTLCLLYL